MIFKQGKIRFSSYKDPDCKKAVSFFDNDWVGDYEPKKFKLTEGNCFEQSSVVGSPVKKTIYKGFKPAVLTITVTLDRSVYRGLSPAIPISGLPELFPDLEDSVTKRLEKLEKIVKAYNGSIHSAPYVKVEFGDNPFKGVCTDWKVDKKDFDRDGELRVAEVFMEFTETMSMELARKQANNQSPDITHHYVVKDGDTLPTISNQIYGTTSLYLELARANKLNSIRHIEPGTRLVLPPLNK